MQPLTGVLSDNISPQMLQYNKGSTRCRLNETVKISAPYFFDVLDPSIVATLTVLDPNGDIVTAKDGTSLAEVDATKDYEITLTEYGVWSIVYYVGDNRGNSISPSYVVRVGDDVPPTITINNAQTSYALGDTLVLPSVTVQDNYSSEADVQKAILVRNPQGVLCVIDESEDYKLNIEGEYTVYYYVIDEESNVTVSSYDITVGGAN